MRLFCQSFWITCVQRTSCSIIQCIFNSLHHPCNWDPKLQAGSRGFSSSIEIGNRIPVEKGESFRSCRVRTRAQDHSPVLACSLHSLVRSCFPPVCKNNPKSLVWWPRAWSGSVPWCCGCLLWVCREGRGHPRSQHDSGEGQPGLFRCVWHFTKPANSLGLAVGGNIFMES